MAILSDKHVGRVPELGLIRRQALVDDCRSGWSRRETIHSFPDIFQEFRTRRMGCVDELARQDEGNSE